MLNLIQGDPLVFSSSGAMMQSEVDNLDGKNYKVLK